MLGLSERFSDSFTHWAGLQAIDTKDSGVFVSRPGRAGALHLFKDPTGNLSGSGRSASVFALWTTSGRRLVCWPSPPGFVLRSFELSSSMLERFGEGQPEAA